MNVLFVTHYWAMMGANRSLLQLVLELRDKGVNPLILGPRIPKGTAESLKNHLQDNGIEYITVPFHLAKGAPGIRLLLANVHNRLLVSHTANILKKYKVDIIHSNSSVIDFGALLSKKLRIPHVWHLREFGNLDYGIKPLFGHWGEKHIYSGNHQFIAISKIIRDHFAQYMLITCSAFINYLRTKSSK